MALVSTFLPRCRRSLKPDTTYAVRSVRHRHPSLRTSITLNQRFESGGILQFYPAARASVFEHADDWQTGMIFQVFPIAYCQQHQRRRHPTTMADSLRSAFHYACRKRNPPSPQLGAGEIE